jgi:class 3 adenylate cyclase
VGPSEKYNDKEVTVMFADIVGSTRMYEIMGDKVAEALISNTLEQLSVFVTQSGGKIIKTIGDEIMCRFPQADDAITAAKDMHTFLSEKSAPSTNYKIAIRIGAHHGPIIENNGDIFGDTVNIAARVASIARGGKTMVTSYTHDQLPKACQERCQHFTRTNVKGKEQSIDVFDVAWEQTDELTQIIGNHVVNAIKKNLTIEYRGSIIHMSLGTITSTLIGRGQGCDLVIPSTHASREHCRIEYNQGKFTFSDNSANGSYVKHNQTELFFHQERIPLLGEGIISLGEPSANNSAFLLKYTIKQQ